MTQKQKEQFTRMRTALLKISRGYKTPDQIKRDSHDYLEVLEMSYENIQGEAEWAVKGVRQVKQ